MELSDFVGYCVCHWEFWILYFFYINAVHLYAATLELAALEAAHSNGVVLWKRRCTNDISKSQSRYGLRFMMVRRENPSARYKDQETDATSRVRRGYAQCASGLTSPVGGGCCSSLPYQDAGADMMHKMIEIAPL